MAKTGQYAQRYWYDRRVNRALSTMGYENEIDAILPTGRAPRGQGQEYADRRWIHNAISVQSRYESQNRRTLNQSRGQSRRAGADWYRRQRISILESAITAATNIALSDAEWGFKRDIVKDIFQYSNAQAAALRE